jgi:hypothetical protein
MILSLSEFHLKSQSGTIDYADSTVAYLGSQSTKRPKKQAFALDLIA